MPLMEGERLRVLAFDESERDAAPALAEVARPGYAIERVRVWRTQALREALPAPRSLVLGEWGRAS